MYEVMTLYEVSLFYYQIDSAGSAVNRNPAHL